MSELSATNCGCGNSMDKYVLQDKYEIRNEWLNNPGSVSRLSGLRGSSAREYSHTILFFYFHWNTQSETL